MIKNSLNNVSSKAQSIHSKRMNKAVAQFMPKTGIEQPFMKERPRFKETHKEFEPIHCMNVRLVIISFKFRLI